MAIKRSDTRLLLGATAAVLAAGLLIAAGILLVMGRGGDVDYDKPIPYGDAAALRTNIEEEGPVNYAGATGDSGFWVALEDGKIVALLVQQPDRGRCNVRFALSKGGFVDCNDERLETEELARYRSEVPTLGDNKGKFVVHLREVLPAPHPAGSAN